MRRSRTFWHVVVVATALCVGGVMVATTAAEAGTSSAARETVRANHAPVRGDKHPQTAKRHKSRTLHVKTKVRRVPVKALTGRGGGPQDDYPSQWRNAGQDSVFDNRNEYNRECTSFVAWALSSRNGFTMPFNDNAIGWGADARARGFTVNMSPQVGSVAWSGKAPFGHVAWVESVQGSSVGIQEYNELGNGKFDARTVPVSAFTGYIHFKDIASASLPPAPPPPPPSTAPPATAPPAPATHAETTGAEAHTWTNPSNAGGNEGPVIAKNQTVQIACVTQGFKVQDGNTNWYRIAQDPWDNNYYVSADAFYDNGMTSGSLIGTPNVDPAVPPC